MQSRGCLAPLLSCVAACASVFEEDGIRASGVAFGTLLACAVLIAMAQIKVGTTHNNFILFSNSR